MDIPRINRVARIMAHRIDLLARRYLVHLSCFSNTCFFISLHLSLFLSSPRIRDVLGSRPPNPSNMRTLYIGLGRFDGRKERFMSTIGPLSGRRSRLKFSAVVASPPSPSVTRVLFNSQITVGPLVVPGKKTIFILTSAWLGAKRISRWKRDLYLSVGRRGRRLIASNRKMGITRKLG